MGVGTFSQRRRFLVRKNHKGNEGTEEFEKIPTRSFQEVWDLEVLQSMPPAKEGGSLDLQQHQKVSIFWVKGLFRMAGTESLVLLDHFYYLTFPG